jgi:hypothetical protein
LTSAAVYVPFQQQYVPNITIAARATHGQRIADQLPPLLASMNPNLPVVTAQTLDDSVAPGLAASARRCNGRGQSRDRRIDRTGT